MDEYATIRDEKERKELTRRILRLTDEQILLLFKYENIRFGMPLSDVIQEIRANKENSYYASVLLDEAPSYKVFLRWLSEFEKS